MMDNEQWVYLGRKKWSIWALEGERCTQCVCVLESTSTFLWRHKSDELLEYISRLLCNQLPDYRLPLIYALPFNSIKYQKTMESHLCNELLFVCLHFSTFVCRQKLAGDRYIDTQRHSRDPFIVFSLQHVLHCSTALTDCFIVLISTESQHFYHSSS